MNVRTEISNILSKFYADDIGMEETINSILLACEIEPYVILFQDWENDSEHGWSSWGWFYENGNIFDKVGYEMEEILDQDKFGNITKAKFKLI